jgi:hypothetical protein
VVTGDETKVEGWLCWTGFGSAVNAGAARAELTTTVALFEVTVTGILELSVTLRWKLHAPTEVSVVVENV